MKISNINFYKDGGTVVIVTDEGDFYVDRRVGTTTENKVFDSYPDTGNEVPLFIISDLKKALENLHRKLCEEKSKKSNIVTVLWLLGNIVGIDQDEIDLD